MSKSDLALTAEEIEQERENYAIESRKIWAKNVSRARKLELSSKLKLCSERIADAQLTKVLAEIDKILDSEKVRAEIEDFIREHNHGNKLFNSVEMANGIIALIKKAIKEE